MIKWILTLSIVFSSILIQAQSVSVIHFDQLEKQLKNDDKKFKVFNFWATFCKPCIIEMPQFEQIQNQYPQKVDVYLISLDDIDDKSKVERFILQKQLKSKVYLLDETDYNSFIDKIDSRWSGAIPATLIITPSGKKLFYEKEFKEGELNQLIKTL